MPFPLAELNMGGQYAIIVTLSNQLRIFSIKAIHGSLFYIPEYGIFQLDEKYRYALGKAEIYFYAQKAANPIDILAFDEFMQFLETKGMATLTMADILALVTKIKRMDIKLEKKAETVKAMLDKNVGGSVQQVIEGLRDGTIDQTAAELAEVELREQNLANRQKIEGYEMLSPQAIQWFNDFFREDIIASKYVDQMISTNQKYKIKASTPLLGIFPQSTTGKRHIMITVVQVGKSRYLEVDPKIKVDNNFEKDEIELASKKFGNFIVKNSGAVYRYGKTRVYVVSVKARRKKPSVSESSTNTAAPVGPDVPQVIEQPKEEKGASLSIFKKRFGLT